MRNTSLICGVIFQVLECSKDLRVLEAKVEEARKNSNGNGNGSGNRNRNRNSGSKEGSAGENENDKFVDTVHPFLNIAKVYRGYRDDFQGCLCPLVFFDLLPTVEV